MLLLDYIAQIPPRGPHALADGAMGSVAFAGLIFEGGTIAAMASAASFVYFAIQIVKEIAKWIRTKRQNRK